MSTRWQVEHIMYGLHRGHASARARDGSDVLEHAWRPETPGRHIAGTLGFGTRRETCFAMSRPGAFVVGSHGTNGRDECPGHGRAACGVGFCRNSAFRGSIRHSVLIVVIWQLVHQPREPGQRARSWPDRVCAAFRRTARVPAFRDSLRTWYALLIFRDAQNKLLNRNKATCPSLV